MSDLILFDTYQCAYQYAYQVVHISFPGVVMSIWLTHSVCTMLLH